MKFARRLTQKRWVQKKTIGVAAAESEPRMAPRYELEWLDYARMRWRVPMRIVRKTNMRSSEQAFLVAKNRNPMYIKGPQNQC